MARLKEGMTDLQAVAIPLFVFFVAAYLLLTHPLFPEHSKEAFIIKLLVGIGILGFFGTRLISRAVGIFVPWHKLDWVMVALSVGLGALILYVLFTMRFILDIPPDAPNPLTFYGKYSLSGYELYAVIPLTIAYVLVEEIFFRGVVYMRLKRYLPLIPAALVAALIFMLVHLNFIVQYATVIFLLSLCTIVMLERTGTLFYGFITHIVLDILVLFAMTDNIIRLFPHPIPTTAGLSIFVALCATYIWNRDLRARS